MHHSALVPLPINSLLTKSTELFVQHRQVTANQLALAPIVLGAVFAWNLTLTGQSHQLKSKLERDLVPSMINGNSSMAQQCESSGISMHGVA